MGFINFLLPYLCKSLLQCLNFLILKLICLRKNLTLTRALQLRPPLRHQRETVGQRLDQASKRGVRHHHHLLPVELSEEAVQHSGGGLAGKMAASVTAGNGELHTTEQEMHLSSYLSTKEVMVEHVVVTELLLTVELSISAAQTKQSKIMQAMSCTP